MTKADFEKRYPNGLNGIITAFEKALYGIMSTDEIDKIIESAGWKERRHLKRFKTVYLAVAKDWGSIPIWELLYAIQSPILFENIIAIMVFDDKTVYHGEDEE